MRVLVTGGAGFIGSHVVGQLLDMGHEVVVVFDREKPGKIPHLEDRVEWLHRDIRTRWACKQAVEDVDTVIHLAALISVDESIQHPTPFYETNVRGTMNLLEACRTSDVSRFVYMSTAEVYGSIDASRANERYPCHPRSPYAASKYAAERYCLSWSTVYPQPEITVLRGFNTYGPRQSYGAKGAVVATFTVNALRDEPLAIRGTGDQTRDFVYVGDMADGIIRAAMADGLHGQIFNLATGQATKILSLAFGIKYEAKSDSRVILVNPRRGENSHSCGYAAKAREVLGWKVRTPLAEGLKKTVEWYREAMR